jgi:hypothetical protein
MTHCDPFRAYPGSAEAAMIDVCAWMRTYRRLGAAGTTQDT